MRPVSPEEIEFDTEVTEQVQPERLKGLKPVSPDEIDFTEEVPQAEQVSAGPDYSQKTWAEVGKEAFGNVPRSAVRVIKDIGNVVFHPVQTVKGVGRLGLGIIQKFVPGRQEDEQIAEAVWNELKNQYGSEDAIKKTIATNPVQVAIDLASLFAGIGGVLAKTGKVAKISKLEKAGELASTMARYADPLNVAAAAIKSPLKLVPEKFPEKLYKSGLKPSTTLTEKARSDIIQTALRENLPLTKGLKKSEKLIEAINDEIDKRIELYQAGNFTISRDAALKPLKELVETLPEEKALPLSAIKEAKKTIKEFERFQPERITIKKARKLTKDLNKELNNFYKKIKTGQPVNTEDWARVRAALNKGIREEVANIFPEIRFLNKRQSALLELNKELRRAVGRIDNRNIFSLIGGMYGNVGGGIAGVKGAIGMMLANYIFNNPRVNSRLAIALYKGKRMALTKGKWRLRRLLAEQAGARITNAEGESNQEGGM